MRIKNTTSLNDDVVRAIVAIICKGMTQNIKSVQSKKAKRAFSGRCYYPDSPEGTRIVVRIAEDDYYIRQLRYPFTMNNWHNECYPRFEVRDELELAIAILAHEVYHLKADLSKGRFKNTQIRAERYAMRILQMFREKYLDK